jgi:TP901 family phage tail tape measure protein
MAQKRTFTEVNKRIADLTIQLQKLTAEYKKLESEGKTAGEINETLGKKIESVSKKLSTISNVTRQYNKQVGISNAQRKETNANLERAVKTHTNLTGAINKNRIAQDKANASNKTFGDGLASVFSPASIGRAIGSVTKFISVYTILQGVADVVKNVIFGSIQAFIDFEDGLGRLGAVTGASAQQMKVLGDRAREVAVQTRFTTTEVVALQVSLAKLGATAEEIPDLIFPIALAAQATGESLDAVGETIVKVNNQFGLSSSEVAVTAQTLVAAINESALSLDSFGTAIQYVGPIANQVGLTFQETSAFLGVLADNGFSASRIGTGLRTIFTDLKESGVDLTDTLKDLSNQNIGVAEATDLVGRRAAAQLLVLLQNIDVVEELSTVEEGLRSTLAASASQMATTAGQAQILKSAYEELQISIGEVITNSNFFISVIRLISRESAQLALGYRDLDKITKELGRDINDEIGLALKNTGKEFEQLQSIIEQSSLGPEFEKIFAAFSEGNIKNIDQVRAALEKVVKPLGGLEELGDTERGIFGFGGAGADEAERLLGIVNIFDELIQKSQEALQVGEKRDAIVEAYQDELAEIKKTTNAAERLNKVTSLEVTISSDILFLEGEITKEREKGILADQGRIKNLEGIVSGYKQVKNLLSDIIDETEKEDKAAKDARDKRAKADIDDIKRRKAQIREEIKLIREQRQSDLKALEERAKLQGEAATTTEQRASIELKLNQDIADLNDKTNKRLEYQFGQFIQLSDDAGEVIKKYGTEFPNVVEQLSETVNDLNKDFFELSDSIEMSLSDVANDAINDAKSILSTYKKQVDELNESFGENAEKTEEYFAALEQLTSSLGAELLTLADGINRSTEEGEAAYQIILQLLGKVEDAAKRPSSRDKQFDWGEFWKETLVDALQESIDIAVDSIDRFNQVAFENTKNRLESQRAAIQAEADIENDILKSQLDNKLITEEEFRNRSEANRKKEVARQNEIDKQIFEAEKKRDKQAALSEYLRALASIIPSLILNDGEANPAALAIKAAITAGLATASYGSQISAIDQREFYATKFAEGGVVEGPSHAEGGVPFTVQGRAGYEMEGGEFIVNKRAAAVHRSLLERINGSAKPTPMSGSYAYDSINRIPTKFAQGGPVSPAEANQLTREQVSYLRAIAEATTSTAVGVNKPVRAFITQTDLRNNDLERRIVNKNSRL